MTVKRPGIPGSARQIDAGPRARTAVSRSALASPARKWLGVCLALGERFSFDEGLIRALFILLGIATGPIALVVYLSVYIWLFVQEKDQGAPEIDQTLLLTRVVGSGAAVLALYGVAVLIFSVSRMLYERLIGHSLVLEGLGWLESWHNPLVFWMLFAVLPLAALSGLPVPKEWQSTLKKVVMALIGCYLVVLSAGIASALAGILIRVADEFAG